MSVADINVGDQVMYTDPDQVEWGPWKVVAIGNGKITVLVDGQLHQEVGRDRLQKIKHSAEPTGGEGAM
tara:strand:+ start:1522 stop:1728 length:207 start_codon:yes stop_codon:yes gene_type:complete